MPRRLVYVRGIVQGVGFRPFVHELARRFELGGCVRNQSGRVLIEIEGDDAALDGFVNELLTRPPTLARIDELTTASLVELGERTFSIKPSEESAADAIFNPPDIATCNECLAELFDPNDRRFRYPLLNCTNCGPRFTIIVAAPYDRERTSMAGFSMCDDCRREYENPADRRFHAQPIACPKCGPQLTVLNQHGETIHTADSIAFAASAIKDGMIGAVKGLGGFHLACDARNEPTVALLRERKHRDAKSLAIMVASLAEAQKLCEVSPEEAALLTSPARPIVLLRRRIGADVADTVAPCNPCLGIMLPYSPLHHLLLDALDGMPLVMTSGNERDEPIAYQDETALNQLLGKADFFVAHNRPIHTRCDDTVTRVVADQELPLRRSRGHAPEPIQLPIHCSQPTLALGGQLKTTFALGRGRHAFLSQHLGDLDQFATYQAYVDAIPHFQQLFAIEPEVIVHDMHPDYQSTRYALDRSHARQSVGDTRLCQKSMSRNALASGLAEEPWASAQRLMGFPTEPRNPRAPARVATLAVQHHHAHLASCLAEHGLIEPAIGIIFDGSGFGSDGAIWGGEFLVGDYHGFRRAAHLCYVPLPGGDQAIREPWRMALSYSIDAGIDCPAFREDVPQRSVTAVQRMISQRFNTQPTSSIGRLFDGVAALAGVRHRVDYEGQAAMELEWLAAGVTADGIYPFDLVAPEDTAPSAPWMIDIRPLIVAVAADVNHSVGPAMIARRFHSTLVEIISHVCDLTRKQTGLNVVALSGGVFMNALLLSESIQRLSDDGFRVYRHQRVPPNDGGLSLGQLAIAAAAQNGEDAALCS